MLKTSISRDAIKLGSRNNKTQVYNCKYTKLSKIVLSIQEVNLEMIRADKETRLYHLYFIVCYNITYYVSSFCVILFFKLKNE